MSTPQPSQLIGTEPCGEGTVVILNGELDAFSGSRLGPALDTLTHADEPELFIDLRQVTFADCSGLALLVRAQQRAMARGGRVVLITACPKLLRTLRLTGLDDGFEVYEDLPVR